MKQRFMRSKLSRRFVLFCEFTGYALSSGIFAFVIYSVFTSVDVVTKVSGEVVFSSMPLEVDEDFSVLFCFVEKGAAVNAGDVICQGTKDQKLAQQVKAYQSIAEALSVLKEQTETFSAALETLSSAEQLLKPDFQKLDQIRAPETGIFQPQENPSTSTSSSGKRKIGFIIVPERYEFRATLPRADAQRLLPGQEVRLSVSDLGRFIGQIAVLEDVGENVNIRVPLQSVERTTSPGKKLEKKAEDFSVEATAKVVTGKRSLFAEIFVRRS